jgi:sugar phosphate isomerase/epimerase
MADAAAAGFDFAELAVHYLEPAKGETDFAPIRTALLAAPIRAEVFNCFLPRELKVTGPAVDLAAVRRHMEIALRRAAEVGATVMVFGSGGSRTLPEGFPAERGWEQLAEAARLAAEIADRHGLTVAMEPLFPEGCNLFNRVDQGAALVDRVGHPRLRLLADLFHLTRARDALGSVAAAGTRLAHIHVPPPRIPPAGADPEFDFAGFFDALRQAGYAGRVSVEDNPRRLGQGQLPQVELFRMLREFFAPWLRDAVDDMRQ